jgi:L-threonylcarbamoyladenylate synthase
MGLLLKFKKSNPEGWSIFLKHAFDKYSHGDLLIYPKGAVYHLGGNPFDLILVEELGRNYTDPLEIGYPLVTNSMEIVRKMVDLPPKAEALAKVFWPGDLTMVLPRSTRSKFECKKGSFELNPLLNGAKDTLAVEVNTHPVLDAFFRTIDEGGYPPILIGIPVEIQPDIYLSDTNAILDLMGVEIDYLVLDGGKLSKTNVGLPSSVVRIENDKVTIVREGSISSDEILDIVEK